MGKLVKDLMQHPVATLSLPARVGDVRELMKERSCHAVPLVDQLKDGTITIRGMVTSNDLMGVYPDYVDVEYIMTRPVHIVQASATARSAAAMMIRHRIHHLLVMEGEEVAGILSTLDVIKLVAEEG